MTSAKLDRQTIEADFIHSWDNLEQFYARWMAQVPRLEYLKPMIGLIAKLREQGFDRQFRVGQSIILFILSRAEQHDLRDKQAHLIIGLSDTGGMTAIYQETPDVNFQIKIEKVDLTTELEDLLRRLQANPIN